MAISIHGVRACEDTALVADRLRALAIPFRRTDLDEDPTADAFVRAVNAGNRVTPTVVVDGFAPVAEPSLDELETLLERAGYAVTPPQPTQYHRPLTDRAVAPRTLPVATPEGLAPGPLSVESMRGRSQVALFLAHPPCLVCAGYARHLALAREALAEVDARAVAVVPGIEAEVRRWARELVPDALVLIDADGAWQARLRETVQLPPDDPALLLLDRYLAPRVGIAASEAGGLLTPGEVVEWFRYLGLECPECSLELEWPAQQPVE